MRAVLILMLLLLLPIAARAEVVGVKNAGDVDLSALDCTAISESKLLHRVCYDETHHYLVAQIDAGADAVQIFDSWAGVLGEKEFEDYAIKPVARIIASVRARRPSAKIIAFAKGAGYLLKDYRRKTGADAIGLDWSVPLSFARDLQKEGPVQGNLDPMLMVAGGKALQDGIDAVLQALAQGPLIFNLGHGITPQADPENVTRLVQRVRAGGAGA